jgi:hypothetical protein
MFLFCFKLPFLFLTIDSVETEIRRNCSVYCEMSQFCFAMMWLRVKTETQFHFCEQRKEAKNADFSKMSKIFVLLRYGYTSVTEPVSEPHHFGEPGL